MSGFIPVVEYADGSVAGVDVTLPGSLEAVFGREWVERYGEGLL